MTPLETPIPFYERVGTIINLRLGPKEEVIYGTNGKIKEKTRRLLKRARNMDRLITNDGHQYIPSAGIEVETFAKKHDSGKLPYGKIKRVTDAGIPKDRHDSFPFKPKKYEAALKPTTSYRILLLEIMELYKRSIIIPRERKKESTFADYNTIHTTFGGITRDFPSSATRERSQYYSGKENITENDLHSSLEDWQKQSSKEKWQRRHMLSDVFLFTRLLDASLYATSPQKIKGPFRTRKKSTKLAIKKGYIQKGYSGVVERENNYSGIMAMELRTSELWGPDAFQGLARYLISGQLVAASLISFQNLPMETRDDILDQELAGNYQVAQKIVEDYPDFPHSKDKILALTWLDLRREFMEISKKYALPNPAAEYWEEKFTKFADILEKEGEKHDAGSKDNMIKEVRKLLITYRKRIKTILKSDT